MPPFQRLELSRLCQGKPPLLGFSPTPINPDGFGGGAAPRPISFLSKVQDKDNDG